MFLPALLSLTLAASAQSFSVSFPAARSAQPLDGRVLLCLSTDSSDEPRNQINDTPKSQMVFGVTVDGLKPGEPVVVDDKAWGYPIRSLKDVPPGEYTVQAVLNKYETFHRADGKVVKLHMDQGEGQHWNISPRNLYSKPQKVMVKPGGDVIAISHGSGDSAHPRAEGHEVYPPHQDSERGADEVLGTADAFVGDCAGS